MMISVIDEVLEPNLMCDECLETIECGETSYEIIIGGELMVLCEHCYINLLEIMQVNSF